VIMVFRFTMVSLNRVQLWIVGNRRSGGC